MTGQKMPAPWPRSCFSWLVFNVLTGTTAFATDCSLCPRRILTGAVHLVIGKMRIVVIGIKIIKIQYTHFHFANAVRWSNIC